MLASSSSSSRRRFLDPCVPTLAVEDVAALCADEEDDFLSFLCCLAWPSRLLVLVAAMSDGFVAG